MSEEVVNHYLYISSAEFGTDRFGPYDSENEAYEAMKRVEQNAHKLQDGVRRTYWVSTNPNEEWK